MTSKKVTMSVRFGICGGDIIYLSIIIFTGKDSNKAYDKHVIESFDSGNFVVDWYNATNYIARHNNDYDISYSNGITDFINLSGLYEEVYLRNTNGEWQLDHFKPDKSGKFFELYIEKANLSQSWEEFKNYCKNYQELK
jgi:predicted small secreted protein